MQMSEGGLWGYSSFISLLIFYEKSSVFLFFGAVVHVLLNRVLCFLRLLIFDSDQLYQDHFVYSVF